MARNDATARTHPVRSLALMAAALLVCFVLAVAFGGSVAIPPGDVVKELLRGQVGHELGNNFIIWQLRLPVACACVLVGAILGVVGSAFQALFRNPLADPFIVGVASGAAVGGVIALVMGLSFLGTLTLPVAGFITGLGSLALVLFLSKRRGHVDISSLLLAGTVTGSLLAAVQSLVLLMAGKDTNEVLRWLLGSMHPMFWDRVTLMLATLAVGVFILILQARKLNALAIGEDAAHRLGVNVKALRNVILVTGTAMVAVCVGSVGIIGFLGLAAPHIARRVVGVDWRWSLLGSLLTGSSLLLVANVIATRAAPTGELPVGIVTALLGAPFLLVLLRRD